MSTSSTAAAAVTDAAKVVDPTTNNKSSRTTGNTTTSVAAQWKKQLITKEDPNHIHKTLGILVLLSFIWRFVQVGETDLGFATRPNFTIPTIGLHLALNLSSLEFNIPTKRITSGYRIWPEYRLHSLVFLCRSLTIIVLNYIEQQQYYYAQPKLPNYVNLFVVLLTMAAADWSSYVCQGDKSGFARQLDTAAITKYLFSAAQFYATTICLFRGGSASSSARRNTMQFVMILIIQVNAFLMTLRRKNLASHHGLIAIYGCLLVGFFPLYRFIEIPKMGGMIILQCTNFIAIWATLLRTGPRLPVVKYVQNNKYVLWTCLFLVKEQYLRPLFLDGVDNSDTTQQNLAMLTMATRISVGLLLALGYYKHTKQQQSQSQSDKKKL